MLLKLLQGKSSPSWALPPSVIASPLPAHTVRGRAVPAVPGSIWGDTLGTSWELTLRVPSPVHCRDLSPFLLGFCWGWDSCLDGPKSCF